MDGLSSLGPRPRQAGGDDGQGGMGSAPTGRRPLNSNNPFLKMSKEPQVMHNIGQRQGGMGEQVVSNVVQTVAHHTPGPFGAMLNLGANLMAPTPFGMGMAGGDAEAMKWQQQQMLQQQQGMVDGNNANMMKAGLLQQSMALTSALVSVGNKGADDIAKAAQGQ